MSFDRIDRISEEIKRELAGLIRDLKDPRIPSFVSVVAVAVTRDLSYAKAYISILGNGYDEKEVLKGLNSAAGFIRREIGKRVKLRHVPEFSFVIDHSMERGAHINDLIAKIEREGERPQ